MQAIKTLCKQTLCSDVYVEFEVRKLTDCYIPTKNIPRAALEIKIICVGKNSLSHELLLLAWKTVITLVIWTFATRANIQAAKS